MIAAACLTLGGLSLLIWARNRSALANLAFAIAAIAVAGIVPFELLLMQAETPEQFGRLQKWIHAPADTAFLAILCFVFIYLKAERLWLAWTVCALRTLTFVLNFAREPNLHYQAITSLKPVRFFGETVTTAEGVPSAWSRVGEFSLVMLIVFVFDASIAAWRKGGERERRRALVVGGGFVVCLSLVLSNVFLVHIGAISTPYFISFSFMAVILAMGFELSSDVIRAAELGDDLRESKQRLDMAARAAELGLWVWNVKENETWISDQGRALHGLPPDVPVTFENFFARVHPDDRNLLRRTLMAAVQDGDEYESEYRVLLEGGEIRWISVRGSIERNGSNEPVLMRGASVDITERRQIEVETLELRQELALAGRVSMLGQLASSLVHELNQPLGAILRSAEAAEILLKASNPDLDELRAIVADIHKDDKRAGDVIERLRSLLKRRKLETQPLLLHKLVDDVLALVQTDAARRGVALNSVLAKDLPAVRGDRIHLQQVLLNLIVNAMDAMVDTESSMRLLTVRAQSTTNSMVEIAVTDSGQGIEADKLKTVFEPFVTSKQSGMGMGLTVSRTIVEAHGGRIWAENGAERGATFRFTLPVAEDRR